MPDRHDRRCPAGHHRDRHDRACPTPSRLAATAPTVLRSVVRDQPHGSRARHEKRSYYRIADPFLQFWFRFVEPNRSRLQARRIDAVHAEIEARFAPHVAQAWEDLVRASVPRLEISGHTFGPASRWWGAGLDSEPLEIDIVAESEDRQALLFGECRWSDDAKAAQVLAALQRKAERFPERGNRTALFGLWLKRRPRRCRGAEVLTPATVLRALES